MSRKIATKRRNLEFTIPAIVPISSHARLVKDDQDSVTFEEVMAVHTRQHGLVDPVQFYLDSLVEFGRSESAFKRGVPFLFYFPINTNTLCRALTL